MKGSDTGVVVTIKTVKKSLKITEVYFKEPENTLDWKGIIPLNYTVLPPDTASTAKNSGGGKSDSAKRDETVAYKVRITYLSTEKKERYGEIYFKTNIPEKPEFNIAGTIEAKKE